ncbi:DUF397 domain-containing protein [Streptacidiphilus sp. P02-A3a]|nr:DUF397 domain-containing protein [Streptacidiphilus sp. P02-A3a]
MNDASTLPVAWTKAAASGNDNDCVELASLDGAVFIRDSKNPTGPALCFTPSEASAFLAGAKAGDFDHI